MPTTCAVVDCHNRGGRDQKSFYRIPKVITGQGEAAEQKSERRRRAWIAALNRSDVTSYEQLRVCSDHFISGKPHPYDESNPDWAPNRHLGYGEEQSPSVAARHDRQQNTKESAKISEAAITLLELGAYFGDKSGRDSTEPAPKLHTVEEELTIAEKLELAYQEIRDLKEENRQLKEQNDCLKDTVYKLKAHVPEEDYK